MDNAIHRSGFDCFKELIKQMRLAPDWDNVVKDDLYQLYDTDSLAALLKAGEAMDYQPEIRNIGELVSFNGPALALLKNGHYVCVVNCIQLAADKVGLFNPRGQNGPQTVVLPTEQFRMIAEGRCVVFKNLRDFDARRHSSVYALVSVANHHRVPLNPRRVMHDYAVATDELSPRQFIRVGADNQLKIARSRMKWKLFSGLGHAFPVVNVKKNGKHIIICGYREQEGTHGQIAVIDPDSPPPPPGERFHLWTKEDYEANSSGFGFLIKRTYRFTDEERPFGLLWFVPEFIKLKHVFGHIAFAVLMINVVALIMPLFFQIVVDKVLVNQSYNTLNVIVCAIFCILVFNASLGSILCFRYYNPWS